MNTLGLLLVLLPLLPPRFAQTGSDAAPATTQPITRSEGPATQPAGPTISIHRGALTTVVDATGYFEPIEPLEVRVRPKAYGGELTVKSVAPNGAAVRKGDLLLELDPEQIDKQLAAAENENLAAHANLTRMQADTKLGEEQDALAMKVQTDATKQAEDAVKWFEDVDGPHILKGADLQLKNAKAGVDDQEDELNELKKMYKTDDLTTDTADIVVKRAVRALENSKAQYEMEKQRIEKTKTFIYPSQKRQVVDAAKQAEYQLQGLNIAQAQTKVLRETNLKAGQAGTEASDEKLKELKADRDQFTVRAPADGVVAYGQFVSGGFQGADSHTLRPGEHIAAQQVVMTFYAPGKVDLRVDLPEGKFFVVRPGLKSAVTPATYPEMHLEGTCNAAPSVGVNTPQGPMYALTITLPGADAKLIPAMRANIHIDVPEVDNALLVPNTAIVDGAVWAVTGDGQRERRPVVTGKSDGKQTEIKQGLNEGDQIFVEGQK